MSEQEGQESLGHRLGRLYAVYEQLDAEVNQRERGKLAVDEIEASVQPGLYFPKLMQEGFKALRKLKDERIGYYNKLLDELLASISEFPESLSPREQLNFLTVFNALSAANKAERARRRQEESTQDRLKRGATRLGKGLLSIFIALARLGKGLPSILDRSIAWISKRRNALLLFLALVIVWIFGEWMNDNPIKAFFLLILSLLGLLF